MPVEAVVELRLAAPLAVLVAQVVAVLVCTVTPPVLLVPVVPVGFLVLLILEAGVVGDRYHAGFSQDRAGAF
jgi:hypothetical protein